MKRELFDRIFDNAILPFIKEIESNNPMIELKDLARCKADIHREYMNLNHMYKGQIFGDETDSELLDRHKVASCICGAFLKVSVFNKTKLVEYIKTEKKKVEVYFYYVNEFTAFVAATKFLTFFMISDNKDNMDMVRDIYNRFPIMPSVTKSKRGFWNSVVFNLSQIKVKEQIGLDHYDMYAYAMFFFWLEKYFNDNIAA